MKISVFYDHIVQAAEQTGETLPKLIEEVKAAGIEAVEINMSYLCDHEETYDYLKEAGLLVSCVYEFYEMDRKDETERIKKHLETAAKAGAKKILVVPGFFEEETVKYAQCVENYADTAYFLSQSQKTKNMVKGMQTAVKLGREMGITVTIEDFDHITSPISCVNGMRWFLEQVPGLKITYDTGNFIIHNENVFWALDLLKDHIVHVHCKDRAAESVAVGDGCIPISELVEKIQLDHYEGYFAIEHFDAKDQRSCIQKSAAFLRRHT